jgi:uncharacterized protein YbaP (TraB family)
MMKLRKLITALLVTFSLSLCFIVNVGTSQETDSKNTLWQVSSGENSVYLLGSLHLLKRENYPLNEAIERAFNDSQTLVLEVDMKSMTDPKTQQMTLSRGMLPQGDSLDKQISKETYELAREKTQELGLDISAFKQFKPWFFAMTLTVVKLQTLGFNPQDGLDMYLFSRAKEAGKLILGLETFKQQLEMLDTLSTVNQDKLLSQTFKDLDILENKMDIILKAWSTGDIKVLESTMLKSFKEYPVLFEKLIIERNKNWMKKIESFLKNKKNYMVVVGAAHLAGEQGIVELLKKKGYPVEQL